MARRLGLGIGTGKAKASATRYEKTPEIGPFVNPNAPKHYTDNSYEDMYRWRAPQPERDKYGDLGQGDGFKSIYEDSRVYVNPEKGSDNFQWFGGERRPKTQQEYDVEWRTKFNDLNMKRQVERQNWEIGEARKQQDEEAAAMREYMENLQRAYDKQRKEMARAMEEQRIAAQNQMAAAKAKGNTRKPAPTKVSRANGAAAVMTAARPAPCSPDRANVRRSASAAVSAAKPC